MPPYQNRRADSIGRLILEGGRSRADATRRSGEIWGGAVASVGQQVGQSFADLMRAREDAPRRQLEQDLLGEQTREVRGQKLLRELGTRLTNPETGQVDAPGLARELRTAGYADLAEGVETKVRAQQDRALGDLLDRVRAHQTLYGQGAQLLREIESAPNLYPSLRPKLVDLASQLDPQLAGEIPEAYEPERVKGMLHFTIDAAKDADVRTRSLAALQAAQKSGDDALERDTRHREALAGWLSTAKSHDDWTASQRAAREFGIDERVIAAFGEWSPDAPTRAAETLLTPQQRAQASQPPSPGSREDRVLAAAERLYPGRPYATLNGAQRSRVNSVVDAEGRAPERPPATDDPELPRGVTDWLYRLSTEGLDFDTARQRVAGAWADLRRDHPRVDAGKVDTQLRNLFRPTPGSGTESLMDALFAMSGGGTGAMAPPSAPGASAPAVPAPPQAPAPAPAAPRPLPAPAAPTVPVGPPVSINVPGLGPVRFPNQAAADAFLREAGLR